MASMIWRQRLRRSVPLVLMGGGMAILIYCGLIRADAWIYQRRQEREIARRAASTSPAGDVEAVRSGLVGRIGIARLGLSAVIAEGADETVLQRAVGHVPGTALPGKPGNVGLAGHRDTFFRILRDVRPNDIVVLATERGEFLYRVVSTQVVGPHALEVLDSTAAETVTLITCYPFSYIGAAPSRFIVRAERTHEQPK